MFKNIFLDHLDIPNMNIFNTHQVGILLKIYEQNILTYSDHKPVGSMAYQS